MMCVIGARQVVHLAMLLAVFRDISWLIQCGSVQQYL